MIFSSVVLSPTPPTPNNFLQLLIIQHLHLYVSFGFFFYLFTCFFFSVSALWLSDVFERDLVEMVLEVAVSQISQRQRDMLLRQVGVLLGVLDSDILVQEISAFHEQR